MAAVLTILEAMEALSIALVATPRFEEVNIKLENGVMSCFNGHCAGWAPIPPSYGPVILNASRLKANWSTGSTLTVAEKFAVLKKGKTQVRLLKQPLDTFMIPEQLSGGFIFPSTVRNAVLSAAQFMSENALHQWANTVTLNEKGALATNNQIVVRFPTTSPFHVTFPKWAIKAIPETGPTPIIAISDTQIKFQYANGVVLQATRLAVDLPDQFGRLVDTLEAAKNPVGLANRDLQSLSNIGARFVTVNEGLMTVTNEKGEEAETPTSLIGNVKMSIATMSQVLAVATHFDVAEDGSKVIFSGNGLLGIAMPIR